MKRLYVDLSWLFDESGLDEVVLPLVVDPHVRRGEFAPCLARFPAHKPYAGGEGSVCRAGLHEPHDVKAEAPAQDTRSLTSTPCTTTAGGAGAVVTKDVPPGAIVGGNPAKLIRYRDMEHYNKLKAEGRFH